MVYLGRSFSHVIRQNLTLREVTVNEQTYYYKPFMKSFVPDLHSAIRRQISLWSERLQQNATLQYVICAICSKYLLS